MTDSGFPYDLMIFDLDGTLTDSHLGITRSVQHALSHVGIAVENLAAAIARFSSPATPGGTFNIADPKPLTFGDYAGLFVPDDSLLRRRAQWPDWLLDMAGHAPVVGSAVRHLSSDCILECSKAEIAGWAPELGTVDLVRARGYG